MDYSGEIYGNEHNHPEGLSSGGQFGIGSLIQLTVYNYDQWRIKDWGNRVFSARNYDNAVNGVTRFFDSLYSSFKSLFGRSPKTQAQPIATPQFSNYQSTTGWQKKGFKNLNNSEINHSTYNMQEDPLKKHSNKVKHTLEEWVTRYKDKSWGEIVTESGWKDGQPLGPKQDWRYINAPDGKVMDMRHVSIVGYGYGEGIGNTVEHLQNLVPRMRPSAFDPQDYYSNKIGAYFYQLRHSGNWSSKSWAQDFKRFMDVHYRTIFSNYKP